MPFQTSIYRTGIRFLLLAATPAIMTACAADLSPSPMPTGYKYNNDQYKVSAGPATVHVYPGEYAAPAASAPVPNDTVAAAPVPPAPVMAPVETVAMPILAEGGPKWKAASDNLIMKMESDFGRLEDAVYLPEAGADQPGAAAFRQALSDTMTARRYKISSDAKAPFRMDYSVVPEPGSGRSLLSLTVFSQGAQAAQESGLFDVSPGAMNGAMPAAAPAQPAAPVPLAVIPVPPKHPAPVAGATTVPAPVPAPPPAAPTPAAASTPGPGDENQPTYIYDGHGAKAVRQPAASDESGDGE